MVATLPLPHRQYNPTFEQNHIPPHPRIWQPLHNTTCACLQRPRIVGAEEPAIAVRPAGCSPISSWWALKALATRARLGDGRRLSGERCGGCGTIGEEIVQHPPQPAFVYAGPGPTCTQTRKGVFNKFKRGAMKSCRVRVDPETRRLNAASGLRQSPVHRERGQGDMRIYLGHKDQEAGPPGPSSPANRITLLDHGFLV